MTATLEDISAFGLYNFKALNYNSPKFIVSFVDREKQLDAFRTYCEKILHDGGKNINTFMFSNILYSLINDNPTEVDRIVFNILDDHTKMIGNLINERIENHTFTIEFFKEVCQKNFVTITTFSRHLYIYENSVKKNLDNKKKYSHVVLIANYLFYRNVLNREYYYENSNFSLQEIFGNTMENMTITIHDIISLFKMFEFYEKLSYAAGDKREKLFGSKNKEKFMVGMGSNQLFVKSLIKYVDENLRKIGSNSTNKDKILKEVRNVMKMATKFDEIDMVMLYFINTLQNRLLKSDADLEAERAILNCLKIRKSDNRLLQRMFDMIRDIENCRKHKKFMDRLEIKVTSEKYIKIGLDPTKLDKTKVTILPLSYAVWDCTMSNDETEYNVPIEVQPYLDIFTAYFTKRYKHREITYNFNQGYAIVNMTIGGIDYRIEVTTPQFFLLLQFNKHDKLTAIEIAENMGISLRDLTPVLNSFLKCSIINREPGEKTDPNLKFYINDNFKYNKKEFSIVSLINSQN